ncbi:TRAP transporter TAXI family solute receptor [Azospirillum fermentarium]|uniref:TAXI family TRAP transporter solute-binding subunit n=1 Tax=Azospirillum fermentarium TaxID=1233114 RepID=UPI002226CCB7|nr:TAXI family TRAP transporter solute-binding subunit [Azospirillum fermentarium]MCW2249434.1 TRAP transporter TAXI family solute receptor [Azospirillum fermentarium]
MTVRAHLVRVFALLGILSTPGVGAAQTDDVPMLGKIDKAQTVVGTGGITGVYYPVGGALCASVNRTRPAHGVRCTVQPSAGSVANIEDIRAGRRQFAIVQSDVHFNAYKGVGSFKERGAFTKLRSVFSLYPESLTIVANPASGINGFEDLKGKKVNVGPTGSGVRATLDAVMGKVGWTYAQFADAADIPQPKLPASLCARQVDAVVYLAGHPNSAVQEVTNSCPSTIIPVSGENVDRLVAENPYYGHAVVPGGYYRNNDTDVKTFGVLATVVTSEDVPADVVYTVVRAVFEDLPAVQKMHMALNRLNKTAMVHAGLTAPLHEGAVRYFRETGLLPSE